MCLVYEMPLSSIERASAFVTRLTSEERRRLRYKVNLRYGSALFTVKKVIRNQGLTEVNINVCHVEKGEHPFTTSIML